MRGAIHTLSDRLPRGWSERINDPPESFQNDVRRLWKEINQIGVNINQLTRLAHRSNDAELKEIMSQTEAALRGLRREVTAVVNHHC
ncbi:plasmid mobilization relaxosome protein MobC [Corynebacterium alimapuense]